MVAAGAIQFAGAVSCEHRWQSYLAGIRGRDPESLTQLYDETSRILYSLAYRILNDTADAEEVILDVFHQVWNAGDRYDPSRGTVWGWLTVMTRNRAIDRLRQASLRRTREFPIEDRVDFASERPEPETESIFAQERTLVRQAMATLALDQRQAIELAFFSGLTHSEVAETLGAPLGTIKTRIRVGIQKLRAALPPSVWTCRT
jgi:RNA polymerase sigma-70 factor, ECF subfamily